MVIEPATRALFICAIAIAQILFAPLAYAVSPRQLVEVVDFTGLSVSPNDKLVAFRTEQASIERNTYDTTWYVQSIADGGPPRRVGEAGAPLRDAAGMSLDEPAIWSPDGKWIYYRALLEGRIDVLRAATDGSGVERVTHDPANVQSFVLAENGRLLHYRVGAARDDVVEKELSEYDSGTHIDRTVSLADGLFRSGMHEGRTATHSLVENEVVGLPLLQQAKQHWKVIDLSTGSTKDLVPQQWPKASLAPSGIERQSGQVVQVSEQWGNGRIAVVTVTGGAGTASEQRGLSMLPHRTARKPLECGSVLCTGKRITAITWRRGADEVVFTVANEAMAQSVLRWNVRTGEVHPVVGVAGQVGSGGRWEPGPCATSADTMICVTAEASVPPRLEGIALDSGSRRVLFEPNSTLAGELQAVQAVRKIEWTDREGVRYVGQFYPSLSSQTAPAPLFISYYRCAGFLRGGMGDEWPLVSLAQRGISALCINSPPADDDVLVRYQRGQAAVESAVEYLAASGQVDPLRVGLGGLSFGAEVAMWVAMHSTVARAVSVSTPVMSPNMHFLMSPWGDGHRARLRRYWQLGTADETPERWRQVSPSFEPDRIRAPVLMQMSEQEYRYSFDYAVPLMLSGRADMYVFSYEKHQKSIPRHKLAVYERNVDWFRFWLLDQKDEDPKKEDQYLRWTEMREGQVSWH